MFREYINHQSGLKTSIDWKTIGYPAIINEHVQPAVVNVDGEPEGEDIHYVEIAFLRDNVASIIWAQLRCTYEEILDELVDLAEVGVLA